MANIKERIETLKRETDGLKQQLKEAKQAAKEGPTRKIYTLPKYECLLQTA